MLTAIGEWAKAFASKFFNVFKIGAAAIVSRVLGAFGLTLVTFNGVLPSLKAFVAGYVTALPAQATQFLGAIGMDVFMTMIISALTVRLAWKVMFIPKSIASQLPGGGS